MRGSVAMAGLLALALAGCAADTGGPAPEGAGAGATSAELHLFERAAAIQRGEEVWFDNTYGGEKFFSFLRVHPDPARRIDIGFTNVLETPRDARFEAWGTINDPDCRANPAGGMDLCDDPTASGVVGIRKFAQADGSYMFGVACASCHAGFDPLDPPTDPNEPTWANIHPTIGNQFLDSGAIFAVNLAPTDVRRLMFAAWPRGTVDTTALFNDHIMNPGTISAFWNHRFRPRFDNGTGEIEMRNGQGGEDDVGGDLAALRVYTNIGVCFFECVAPAVATDRPISIDECRARCPDFPPQSDLDDMSAFLESVQAPQYRGRVSPGAYAWGRHVFEQNCASCHDSSGRQRLALSNDEVNPLVDDPANNTNACRALSTNWEEGRIWAEFSSPVYKANVEAGNRGYRTMPLVGIWSTSPFMHNQSIGVWAPPEATPAERAAAFEQSMWELLQPARTPKVHRLPFALGPFPAGTPLTYVFSRDPATGELLCDDAVENRGHHYGAGLPDWQKAALIEWLKHQ